MDYEEGKNFEIINMKLDTILEKLSRIVPEEKNKKLRR